MFKNHLSVGFGWSSVEEMKQLTDFYQMTKLPMNLVARLIFHVLFSEAKNKLSISAFNGQEVLKVLALQADTNKFLLYIRYYQ